MSLRYRVLTVDGDTFEGWMEGKESIHVLGANMLRIIDSSGFDLWIPFENISSMKTEDVA